MGVGYRVEGVVNANENGCIYRWGNAADWMDNGCRGMAIRYPPLQQT